MWLNWNVIESGDELKGLGSTAEAPRFATEARSSWAEAVQNRAAIELVRVGVAERPALFELVDRYLAELSEHRELPIGPTNARSYSYLPLYWEEPGRHPFFICSGYTRIGFALIREVPNEGTIQMSDFYICPDARRSGIGRVAVAEIWRRFPGSWELQVHPHNEAAALFWPRCIEEFSIGRVRTHELQEEDGRRVQYNFGVAAAQQGDEADRP